MMNRNGFYRIHPVCLQHHVKLEVTSNDVFLELYKAYHVHRCLLSRNVPFLDSKTKSFELMFISRSWVSYPTERRFFLNFWTNVTITYFSSPTLIFISRFSEPAEIYVPLSCLLKNVVMLHCRLSYPWNMIIDHIFRLWTQIAHFAILPFSG